MIRPLLLIAAAFLTVCSASFAQPKSSEPTKRPGVPLPVLMRVLDAPRPAVVDSRKVMAYELQITNLGGEPCQLQRLECLSNDAAVATFDRESLQVMSGRISRNDQSAKGVIAPGDTMMVYVWLNPEQRIDRLRHRLSVKMGAQEDTLDGAEIAVINEEPIIVGLPFRLAGNWAAIGAPSNTAGHRRATIPVDGRLWVSQRFAIDWVLLGPDGQMAKGDGSRNEDHYCYGAEVLAVADGEIVDVYDEVPTNEPSPDKRAVPITLETIGGNWAALKIADGHYGMYAHLIPGSLRVKKGDTVKKGDVIGLVGNTGNSTAPHLHFHVSTTPHWIPSVGLPYRIDSYTSAGTAQDDPENPSLFQFVPLRAGDQTKRLDLPHEDEVIRVGP